MAELAFPALLAVALLVKHAHHGLRVDAKRHLLNLHGLEQFEGFFLGLLAGCLFGGATGLFGFFLFLIGVLVVLGLRLELGDLFPGC